MDAPQIISAMQTLQNMHMAELSNAQSRTLYSRLGEYEQSPKRSHKPNVKTIGRIYDCRRDTLYVTKAISVISTTPLIATFEKILHAILDTIRRDEPLELPLESYIYNLIYEVPLPPPGRSMKLFTANQVLVCQRPSKYLIFLHRYISQHCINLLYSHKPKLSPYSVTLPQGLYNRSIIEWRSTSRGIFDSFLSVSYRKRGHRDTWTKIKM